MESTLLYVSSRTEEQVLGSSDPIADAIGLLRPRTVIDPALRTAGPWALRFERSSHVKIGVVARGACWLTLDGHEPVRLEEGDFYLLGNPPPYVLAGTLTAPPHPAKPVWDCAEDGVVRIGPEAEEDTYLCGGRFSFEDTNTPVLTQVLPRLVLVRAADPRGKLLAHLSEVLVTETRTPAAGSSLVLSHLAQVLFVHMLRAHAEQADQPTGWLGALNDDGIGAALRAMHSDAAHPWTLKELADISHMSRSAFASSFRSRVGTTPLDYLIQWRMSLARDALSTGTRPISELAFTIGYRSESAFSTAFRRVVGSSPKQFRRTSTGPANGTPVNGHPAKGH
ncbi:AraC family transcriptional regulator [Streptomyces tauricus]|uniref:AraC family transcriptional regulator n=1 Tax=Streptomyces tauricus TaxID=68274 RepID=UPI002244BEC6|nr:AraC family transcriptional regulator [Streptomyces tauricus]MCW8100154.1 AraC family transcriptional regulator [Streptomyces tauricus]